MEAFREWLSQYVPREALDLVTTGLVLVGAVLFVSQNVRILRFLGRAAEAITAFVYKIFGKNINSINKKVMRSAYLNKDSMQYHIVKYFEDMIRNLDLERDGVTVTGMLLFISAASLVVTSVLNTVLHFGFSLFGLAFCAVWFVFFVLFRFVSLTRTERREALIMDAIDLMVSDIKDGVYNAMQRYLESDAFHPEIKPYIAEFVDNIKNKGYSFQESMLQLNSHLGHTFTDFAYKAIMYEEKRDDNMDDLFSTIIETNRNRRTLRAINNMAFNDLKMELILSLVIILGYGAMLMMTEPFVYEFFTTMTAGRVMIIADVVALGCVLLYITNIKAQSL